MANRVRNIVLRVPVTAQEREMIELKIRYPRKNSRELWNRCTCSWESRYRATTSTGIWVATLLSRLKLPRN